MSNANYLNPFDDDQIEFTVVTNTQQQYSLWPVFAVQPEGWNCQFGPASRSECIKFIESNWLSINPFSLVS